MHTVRALSCVALVLFATGGLAQSAGEAQIRSHEQMLASAETHSRSAPYKRILSDDWLTVTPDGRVLHKSEILNNISEHEGAARPYRVELTGMRVDVFGDTAIASYVREYHGLEGEAQGRVMRESVVDVFTKSGDQWSERFEKAVPLNAAEGK